MVGAAKNNNGKLIAGLLAFALLIVACLGIPLIAPIIGVVLFSFWNSNKKSGDDTERMLATFALLAGLIAFIIFFVAITGMYFSGESVASNGSSDELAQ